MVRIVLLTCPSLLVHRPLHRCKVVLHTGIVGVDLQSLLIRVISAEKVALSKEGGPLAPPALGPVGLQLCGLLGILEGVVPVLLRGMCGRSVAVEDVVGWVDGNSLCKLVTGVVLSATGEGLDSGSRRTYMASSKFFAAMALLPRALSSSAVDILGVQLRFWEDLE